MTGHPHICEFCDAIKDRRGAFVCERCGFSCDVGLHIHVQGRSTSECQTHRKTVFGGCRRLDGESVLGDPKGKRKD